MTRAATAAILLLGAAAVAEAGVLGFVFWRAREGRRASAFPIEHGRQVAESMGCFGCHGPAGGQPIPNPGSKSGEVPGWTGGTWMMWNKSEGDVRAWILDGHPPSRPADPKALIHMPAFGRFLDARARDDLVAYVLTASQFGTPADEAVAAGKEAALRLGCFGCHGPEGRGLIRNPGSFKGFVPPWDGPDYPDLVRDDAEFRQWVRNGVSDRFRANPAAKVFLDNQAIAMPAYGDRASDEDLRTLAAFVSWVRATPRSGAAAPGR
jgi:mono/diheme cytochrome c family protein